MSKVVKPRKAPASALAKQLNNAKKRAIQMFENAAKTATAPSSPSVRRYPISPTDPIARSHPISPIDLTAQTDPVAPISPIDPTRVRLVRNDVCGVLAAFGCLFAPAALGQSRDAMASFEQGRAAFERQDFSAALQSFEAALAAQMAGPAIHYNIGVAAYRLRRYDRARFAFEEVARTPAMEAIARYNLGLIAKATGDDQTAIDEFGKAHARTADERLRSLARAQLDALAQPAPPQSLTWAAFAASGVGYDDNATLTSSGQALGIARESDVYADTQLVGSVALSPAWRIDADASLLNYADLNEFDQWGFGAGGRYRFTGAVLTWDVGAHLGASYIDGDRFDARESIYVQALRPLTATVTARGRYRLSNVEGSERYPGLNGLLHEGAVRLMKSTSRWATSIAYLLDVTEYDSASLSATRHQLLADVRAALTLRWTARAAVSYRQSDYDDSTRGIENRAELTVGAERLLNERWTLVMQYSLTDNDAEAAEFAYRRNRVFAGVEAIF